MSIHLKVSDCPGVVRILAVSLQPSVFSEGPCIVMEQALGSLHDAVHKGSILKDRSIFTKLPLLQQVASAMECISSTNLVHRDIKPSNVLLFKDTSKIGVCAKLCDFGLSKSMNNDSMSGSVGIAVKGSPAFMGPEVFDANYSSASDVYAYAIMMNVVLSGEKPFPDAPTFAQLMTNVRSKKRPKLYSAIGTIGDALRKLIIMCWQQDPMKRWLFSDITVKLSTIMGCSLDIARHGSSGGDSETTMLINSLATTVTDDTTCRSLSSLSVNEVGELMDAVQLNNLKEGLIKRNVTGKVLSLCHNATDLQSAEYGISSTVLAGELISMINEWKENGVPDGMLRDGL